MSLTKLEVINEWGRFTVSTCEVDTADLEIMFLMFMKVLDKMGYSNHDDIIKYTKSNATPRELPMVDVRVECQEYLTT